MKERGQGCEIAQFRSLDPILPVMVKKNYKEGDWFAVPLDPTGFAVGLAARNSPKGHIILAYFLDKRFDSIPSLEEIENSQVEDTGLVLQVGDLGLINGEWKVIGKASEWNRLDWPMPNFVRREPILNRIWLVTYSDDDPNLVLSEELISEEEAKGLETDALSGYGAAEKKLSKTLSDLEEEK